MLHRTPLGMLYKSISFFEHWAQLEHANLDEKPCLIQLATEVVHCGTTKAYTLYNIIILALLPLLWCVLETLFDSSFYTLGTWWYNHSSQPLLFHHRTNFHGEIPAFDSSRSLPCCNQSQSGPSQVPAQPVAGRRSPATHPWLRWWTTHPPSRRHSPPLGGGRPWSPPEDEHGGTSRCPAGTH